MNKVRYRTARACDEQFRSSKVPRYENKDKTFSRKIRNAHSTKESWDKDCGMQSNKKNMRRGELGSTAPDEHCESLPAPAVDNMRGSGAVASNKDAPPSPEAIRHARSLFVANKHQANDDQEEDAAEEDEQGEQEDHDQDDEETADQDRASELQASRQTWDALYRRNEGGIEPPVDMQSPTAMRIVKRLWVLSVVTSMALLVRWWPFPLVVGLGNQLYGGFDDTDLFLRTATAILIPSLIITGGYLMRF